MGIGLAAVYLISWGGALVSLFIPWVGVMAHIFLSVLRPVEIWGKTFFIRYGEVSAGGMLLGWAMNGFGDWRFGRSRGIIVAGIGYVVWCVVSAALSADPVVSWRSADLQFKIMLPCLVALTVMGCTNQLRNLAWVMVLAYGYVAWVMNAAYFLQGYNRAEQDGFAGGRAAFAIGLVTVFWPAVFLALSEKRWILKGIAAFSAGLLLHATLLTYSRGGLLALLASGIVAFWLIPKRPIHVAAMVFLVAAALALSGPRLTERFETTFAQEADRDGSAESRVVLWRQCIQVMLKNPVFGIGPDRFPYVAVSQFGWKGGEGKTLQKEGHTLWLQTGAELGIPGLLFLLSFYVLCMLRLIPIAKGYVPVSDPWHRDCARMVIAGLCGFIVSAQFVSLEALEIPYILCTIGAGLLKVRSAEAEAARTVPVAVPAAALAGLPAPRPITEGVQPVTVRIRS